MKKIFYIALTIVLGLAGTSCDREKLTYDSEPGEISGKTGTLDLSSFDAIPNNDIKEIEKKPVSRAVDTGDFTVQIFRTEFKSIFPRSSTVRMGKTLLLCR